MAKKKQYDAGDEIEALCNKCKGPTVHVVESVKDDKVNKVLCKSCNSSHRYKDPNTEPKKAKKTATPKKPKKTKEQRRWSRMMGKADTEHVKDYAMNEIYNVYDVVNHETFGEGVVVEILNPTKIMVTFEDGNRTLVQNRELSA
ncbi:MAG: hypothetical protein U5R06_08155 [candidate division KSB1 bacterium]|nr:hypothetical protein [candidate division KSB1 bacterium]